MSKWNEKRREPKKRSEGKTHDKKLFKQEDDEGGMKRESGECKGNAKGGENFNTESYTAAPAVSNIFHSLKLSGLY